MYGLIQKGLQDMISHPMGDQVWSEICKAASCEEFDFEPLHSYPDSLTASLIDACAKRMEVTHEEVLRQFGRYWVAFTAKEGYGPILDLFGNDLKSCLRNLNRMHGHMGAMMPDLKPPRFVVTDDGRDRIKLHYYSSRTGLAPMVVGLIEGLSEKFGEPISIRQIPRHSGSDHDEFEIEMQPQ
jgi:hypothetical protein